MFTRKLKKDKISFGHEIGDYIKDFNYQDLENKTLSSYNIIGKKNYTIIEFWGTWCEPCLKMTPKLIQMQNKFLSKLNILNIAVDNNEIKVKKYIAKNKLDWKFGFIQEKGNCNNSIIIRLGVKFFPTFILLDAKGKISARGTSDNFDKITKLIK